MSNPFPVRRPFSAESGRIVAELLAFWNLCVNYMRHWRFGFRGRLKKMVLFSHCSQRFWITQPTRIFLIKNWKLDFEPCINVVHLRPIFSVIWPTYHFLRPKHFYFTPKRDVFKSRAVLPQELLGRIVTKSLEKFRLNRGGCLSKAMFFLKEKKA